MLAGKGAPRSPASSQIGIFSSLNTSFPSNGTCTRLPPAGSGITKITLGVLSAVLVAVMLRTETSVRACDCVCSPPPTLLKYNTLLTATELWFSWGQTAQTDETQ